MKYLTFSLITVLSLFLLSACQDGSDSDAAQQARESLNANQPEAIQPTNTQTPPPISPAANTGTAAQGAVQHYICPNNCEGSGGPAQGTCPVCGTEYQHNAAYHQQNNNATPTPTPGNADLTQPQITQEPSPAQNAAGEYHYVCSAGCEGGAGVKGNCAKCGAALSHNAAYHQ